MNLRGCIFSYKLSMDVATLKELMNWTAFAAFTDKKLCPAW